MDEIVKALKAIDTTLSLWFLFWVISRFVEGREKK